MLGVVSLQRLNIKTVHLHLIMDILRYALRYLFRIVGGFLISMIVKICCKHVDISLINVHRELINISI